MNTPTIETEPVSYTHLTPSEDHIYGSLKTFLLLLLSFIYRAKNSHFPLLSYKNPVILYAPKSPDSCLNSTSLSAGKSTLPIRFLSPLFCVIMLRKGEVLLWTANI